MTANLLIPFVGNELLARSIAEGLGGETGTLEIRSFPDGETYLRYLTALQGRNIVIVCSLDHPDSKLIPLIFAALTARDLGAASIGLVAPYLAYMRQDQQFNPGEAVTSRYFAKLLSTNFDWLVTVDPHLHRIGRLEEIYDIPTAVMHAAPLISEWIEREIKQPLLVGPDSESEQWVSAVAKRAKSPYIILQKERHGDLDVELSLPDIGSQQDRIPVVIDDILSTARTMIGTIGHLKDFALPPPICIGVHGLFANDAYPALLATGVEKVVTTNTVRHATNAIDVTPLILEAMRNFA